jgi:hypothetical protein
MNFTLIILFRKEADSHREAKSNNNLVPQVIHVLHILADLKT